MLAKKIGNGLIAVGIVLLAIWGGARLHSYLGARSDRKAFEESRASQQAPAPAQPSPAQSEQSAPTPEPPARKLVEGPADVSLWDAERVKMWKESLVTDKRAPLALLKIPRLKIDVAVLEGTDELTLNRGAGWIEGTARPGEKGNVALSAHRDGFFRALKDIAVGDELVLETPRETTRYVVSWTKVVKPEDVSVLDATDGAAVTLVTCYPFYFIGSAPTRFIVRAVVAPGAARGSSARSPIDLAPKGAVGRRSA